MDSEVDGGIAGGSARREGQRRRESRERRVRERHPRLGGLILAFQETPQHERSWTSGGEAEKSVAESLGKRCHDGVFLLHDRRVPSSRANIDHIAVAPTGVWVIDTKRYKGKVSAKRPLFGQARLTIDGRDRSALMDGLDNQVEIVGAIVGERYAIKPEPRERRRERKRRPLPPSAPSGSGQPAHLGPHGTSPGRSPTAFPAAPLKTGRP